jgi:hypothetical protein
MFFSSEIDILEPFFFRDGDTQDGLMRYFSNQAHNFYFVGTPSHSSHINVSISKTVMF